VAGTPRQCRHILSLGVRSNVRPITATVTADKIALYEKAIGYFTERRSDRIPQAQAAGQIVYTPAPA